jgi:hypothetical protein
MFWAFLGNLVKGIGNGVAKGTAAIGKTAVTGAKAIGYTGQELGKGLMGKATTSSPIALAKTGNAAGPIAQLGKVANQIGQVVKATSGLRNQTGASSNGEEGEDQNPMQGSAPEISGSTIAPTIGGGTPLAYASPQGQLELEMLRRQHGMA